MSENVLKLAVRYFRLDRLYGPGMPSYTQEGHAETILEKPPGQVGLVAVHCWNLGEATGPFPIGPDAHCPGTVADWVPTAHEINRDRISKVFDAARGAGVTIFHLAQLRYAGRYPTFKDILADPELRGPPPPPKFERCVRPAGDELHRAVLGPDFPGTAWDTHPEEFDIAADLRPVDSEPVVTDGWQLNGLCRRSDVDTLFYVGYMADICLLNSSGAVREMSGKFGYRCVVLRDCTTAYEYADTHEHRCMNRAVIRQIETGLGYTVSSKGFIEAAERAARREG